MEKGSRTLKGYEDMLVQANRNMRFERECWLIANWIMSHPNEKIQICSASPELSARLMKRVQEILEK